MDASTRDKSYRDIDRQFLHLLHHINNDNMNKLLTILFITLSISAYSQELQFPIIKSTGGVYKLNDAELPNQGGKILIDVTSYKLNKSGISKSIEKIARTINLYGLAGISGDQLEIVVIIHGSATRVALSESAHQAKYRESNPHLEIIDQLLDNNVKLMVCSQALMHRGFGLEAINPKIKLSTSAITTLVEYQQKGYSVLYF